MYFSPRRLLKRARFVPAVLATAFSATQLFVAAPTKAETIEVTDK